MHPETSPSPKVDMGPKIAVTFPLAIVLKHVSKTHYGRKKKKKKKVEEKFKILKLLLNNGKWSYPARASGGRRIMQNA